MYVVHELIGVRLQHDGNLWLGAPCGANSTLIFFCHMQQWSAVGDKKKARQCVRREGCFVSEYTGVGNISVGKKKYAIYV